MQAAVEGRRSVGRARESGWRVSSLASAAAITAAVFVVAPYLESLARQPVQRATLRRVNTVAMPSPAPLPPPAEPASRPRAPVPAAPAARARAQPGHLPVSRSMTLDLIAGGVNGDFDLNFDLAAAELAGDLGAAVFEVADVDEPPRPLAQLQPLYPPAARMRGVEGDVVVEFVVQADGTPADVAVVTFEPDDVFVPVTLQAVRRWRFRPGMRGGEPVAVRVRQKVSFRLE